jgi:hypothetical protein
MIDPTEFGKAMGAIVREAVEPLLRRIDALEAIQPQKGESGPQGEPGKDAEPVLVADVVKELLETDAIAPIIDMMVAESVAKHFEDNPVQNGKDGSPGEKGDRGDVGEKGMNGADGIGLASAMIDRDGQLVVTKTNGESIALGAVIGKDGAPGKDGSDGLGFDDCDITYDGERGFTIKWQQGDRVMETTFHVPTVIDRGYWREGTQAQTGDAMTHDGTLWIALRDTKAKPARESEDWRIGARKGRDGAPGPAGKEYKPPEPVKLGNGNG